MFWSRVLKTRLPKTVYSVCIYLLNSPPLQVTQTCSDNPCKNHATCQPGTGGQVCQSKASVTLKDCEVSQMHSLK